MTPYEVDVIHHLSGPERLAYGKNKRDQIWRALAALGPTTFSQVATRVGLSHFTTYRHLLILATEGRVAWDGTARALHVVIPEAEVPCGAVRQVAKPGRIVFEFDQ